MPVSDPILSDELWSICERLLAGPSTTSGKLPVLLGTIDGVLVWLVNGNLIRRLYFPDFLYGGHDLVYGAGNSEYPDVAFVPREEIWLDGLVKYEALLPALYHEVIERTLMEENGLSYGDAHEIANASEMVMSGRRAIVSR